ncbi:hypothetical protein SEA_LASTRESORT_48 [Gordonia phage LastResort]|uniref:Uncharacterized protein n=2 Tax=Soupsvirus soups TaxID=1982563 RepID=A0A161HTI7_9CAUD|nr:transcriptional regulator [Gordonia phage KatherineG]YP_009269347.1 transcriptional regulator [Gordonia phage Soups]ASZ73926.1 hypothetical protein SEA_SHAYRA_50 [Gordonia phage ShayRa]AXH47846.1 hypothetical protein SEA_LASTRESORT_48 [Gordonia phage LastResort]QDM56224.1 hypothetical protein SEA_REMO_48 [Gordonia phage ReMo]QWS67830.1 hypothetical protein SEA_DEKHOCKEY33_49 [Gordonia phage DekHockey33]QZD98697.1 hypothetical protein SEA_LOOPER_49 [Gordonia phage Looper]UAJ15540.1 hypothe
MSTHYTVSNQHEDLFAQNKVRLTIDVKLETALALIKQAEELDKPKPFDPSVYYTDPDKIGLRDPFRRPIDHYTINRSR